MQDFRGKTALVTGGASGIGRCIALALAAEGCDLCLVDLDEERLLLVKEEVERTGRSARVRRADVTDPDQVDALAAEFEPHVLVNCAGIAVLAYAESTTLGDWRRVLEVNLWGPILMTLAFLPSLKEKRGYVVNVASADGVFAVPGSAAYSVSKFGLVGFSEVTGIEFSRYGIGVTAVCPGFTWTPMVESAYTPDHQKSKVDRFLKWARPLIFTTPEKVARATIRAVRKDRAIFVHTPAARLIYYAKRLSPRLYRDVLGRLIYRIISSLEQ